MGDRRRHNTSHFITRRGNYQTAILMGRMWPLRIWRLTSKFDENLLGISPDADSCSQSGIWDTRKHLPSGIQVTDLQPWDA